MPTTEPSPPRFPPTPVIRALFGVRRGVRRLTDQAFPAQAVAAERMFAVVELKLVKEVCDLGVPDALDDAPADAMALAARLEADAEALERAMRFLSSRDWFARRSDGRYALNGLSRVLRTDDPDSLRDWVRFMGADWHWNMLNRFGATLRTGRPAAEVATGKPFFDYLHDDDPDAATTFDGAMRSLSALVGPLLTRSLDFDRYRSVCDVGGGTGRTLADLLGAEPHLTGTVFDLPDVVAHADPLLDRVAPGRWQVAGGSFFETVPGGHDLYVLKAIVHDWGDEDATAILGNVRRAMDPGSRAVVVENRLEPGARHDIPSAVDALMLELTDGGRERTQEELERLFGSAGFRIETQTQLPILIWAFTLAPI
jgi:O-methyltransferase domain